MLAIFFGVVIFASFIMAVRSHDEQPPSSASPPKIVPLIDEAAQLIAACGKPKLDSIEPIRGQAGQSIRTLVYPKARTELKFYVGPDKSSWTLIGTFESGSDDLITVAEANRRMRCAKGQLIDHINP